MNSQLNGGIPDGYHNPRENQTFVKKLLYSPRYAPVRDLSFIGSALGLAFVVFSGAGGIFSWVIRSIPAVYGKYASDVTFIYLCDGVYSFLCVGLPFLLAYVMLGASGRRQDSIPFGKPYSWGKAVPIILGAVGLCFAGNYVTGYFTALLRGAGIEFYSFKLFSQGEPLPDDAFGLVVFAVRTALIPALTEEFALRGVVLQSLRKYGDWFAIITSAVMFGLMHGNMTQVPFALIAGVGLGYCFVTTGSLWCPVIVHFTNNFVSVLSMLVQNQAGDGAKTVFVLVANVVLVLTGALALLVYCVKTPNFARLYKGEYPTLKKKFLTFFLTPPVLITVILMVKKMCDDIIR